MNKKATFKTLVFAAFLVFAVGASAAERLPAPELPPGVIIDKSPEFSTIHVGSPSIEILPNGTYIATHDFFGDGNEDLCTQVFESKDRGETWTQIAKIPYQRATYLFYVQDALWGIGWAPGEGCKDADKNSRDYVTI